MTQERLIANLDEMEQIARETAGFVASATFESFMTDLLMQRALGMNLLMIGEAASRLVEESPDFVTDHPEVPWQKIRGMRHRIAHNYFRIDLETIWSTATSAVPDLLKLIVEIRNPRMQGE